MPIQFPGLSGLHLPSPLAAIKAKFTAFKEKVSSAVSSLKQPTLQPVRPLHQRFVTTPSAPPKPVLPSLQNPSASVKPLSAKAQFEAKVVQNLETRHAKWEEAVKSGDFTPPHPPGEPNKKMILANLEKQLEQSAVNWSRARQKTKLNTEIASFAPSKLKPVAAPAEGKAAKLEVQMAPIQDNVRLKGAPLPSPKSAPKTIGEPQFTDIADGLKELVDDKELQHLSVQLGLRLKKIDTLPKGPERAALQKEVSALAETLGAAVGRLYKQLPPEKHTALSLGSGEQFKAQLWQMLQSHNPKLENVPTEQREGVEIYTPTSAHIGFLNQVYAAANAQLPNHMGSGDKPPLQFEGETYRQVKVLGKGGGGSAFLYESPSGKQVVAKTLGFYEIAEEDLAIARDEIKTHLDLMGPDGQGHPHVLNIKGGVRTAEGNPVAILELAPRGDVEKLVGKPGAEKPGLIDAALKEGALSPQAAQLVKLALLQDTMNGLVYIQDQIGGRHGDIKGSNLFIGADGKAKIADFGTSKSQGTTKETKSEGSPGYMAPEQLNPNSGGLFEVSGKIDTWAVGVMAHQMFNRSMPINVPENYKGVASEGISTLIKAYGKAPDSGARDFISTPAANADKNAPVVGATALDRFINSLMHPDPAQRPSLKEAMRSSLFEDLGGPEKQAAVRELIVALTDNPQDLALIKQKSDALGV